MCGLAGCSFKEGFSHGKRAILMAKLASMTEARGNQSWGVTGLMEGADQVTTSKGMGPISLSLGEFADYPHCMIHTRFATHGAKTIDNAHPFDIGNYIGMHNGVIYNHQELLKKYDRDFEVDSKHIWHHMEEGRPLDDLEGYGVICWINKWRQDTIYLCKMRNGELSIYGIGTKENIQGVVFASSGAHIEAALKVSGITEYFSYNVEQDTVYAITNGKVYLTPNKLSLAVSVQTYKWSDFDDDGQLKVEDTKVIEGKLSKPMEYYRTKRQTDA